MISTFEMLSPDSNNSLPLVFDSPHSGINFPKHFQTIASFEQMKSGWDAYVDHLWQDVINEGAHLLHAKFSRMYIDLNRAPNDIDPILLDSEWPECVPTKYSDRGMGLIRRYALPGQPIYKTKLTKTDVEERIENYYKPYHQILKRTLDQLHQSFGSVWHIDCHSMKSKGNAMNIDNGVVRPDIILGDNCGKCASAEFVQVVENSFSSLGYKVVRNTPYKGGYLITEYADLQANRHSMQIEINRAIYMNEEQFTPNSNYHNFRKDLNVVTKIIAEFVKSEVL